MPNKKFALLLIEDDDVDAEAVRRCLSDGSETFQLVHAACLKDGVAVLAKQPIDLVLLDLGLPDSTGLDGIARVHDVAPEIPIVVLTGLDNPAQAIEAVHFGAQDYLTKDKIDRAVIEKAVHYAIERHYREFIEVQVRKLSQAVEQSASIVVFTDKDGKIEYVNARFTQVTGYTLEEVKGKTPRILKSGQTPEKVYKELWETVIQGKNWQGEFWNRKKNGQLFCVMASISPVKDDHGHIVNFLSIEEDVTEQRHVMVALKESEKRYREQVLHQEAMLAINRSVQAMERPSDLAKVARMCLEQLKATGLKFCALAIQRVVDDARGVFSFYEIKPNDAFNQFTGESPNLFRLWKLGKTVYRPDLDRDAGGLKPEDRQAMGERYGRPVNSILNVCHEHGLLSILSDQADPFSPIDIAFFEQVAQVLAVGMRRLQDMENLDSVVRHVSEGICLLNNEKRLIFSNDIGLGFVKDLSNVGLGDVITHLNGADLEKILNPSSEFSCESELEDGRIVVIVGNPVMQESGQNGWVLIFRDVTREKHVQEKVAQQDRLASIGQLAAGIAHDFNNMLTVMTGFAQLLEMRDDVPEIVKKDLIEIDKQGHRGAQLVRQILDFSRVSESEKYVLDLVPFVKELTKLLERTLSATIFVTTDISAESLNVMGNLTQLQQVLTNLSVNARDAMPKGGTLTFQLRHAVFDQQSLPTMPGMSPGKWVVLKVSDTGTGMSPEVLAKIYEPFFTTKKRGEGTGLGLAQVYGIVKQHNGFIDVVSAEGQGSTFIIYLPQVIEIAEIEPVVGMLLKGSGQTILIAEDDPNVLQSLANTLDYLGYQTILANGGEEALALFETHEQKIDGVVLDMIMPNLGGGQVLEILKNRKVKQPIVLMSGYQVEPELYQHMMSQAFGFFEKPLDIYVVSRLLHAMFVQNPGENKT